MALVGLLDKTNHMYDLAYRTHINNYLCVQNEIWYVSRFHLIQKVEIVEHFKYLGSILNSQLSTLIIQSTFLKDAVSVFFFSDSLVVLVLVNTSWNLWIKPLLKAF